MYTCEYCKYVTKKRFNYDKHLLSNKHKLIAGLSPNMIATKVAKPAIVIECNYCKQDFKSKLDQHAQCKKIYDLTELVTHLNAQLNLQLEQQQTQINQQKLQIDHIISEIF
jgi:hypothetical protein